MQSLDPTTYDLVRPLFAPLDHHLAVPAVLSGAASGRVYVDRTAGPRLALVWTGHRFYLAGATPDTATSTAPALRRFFAETVAPHAAATGSRYAVVYYEPAGWENVLEAALAGQTPQRLERQYYVHLGPPPAWRERVPQGFSVRPVDAELLNDRALGHVDELAEEMCSERPSVEDFLARSFGVCLVHGTKIAGWCLSEYNAGDRCEVGIEVCEPYRRQGLGTLLTWALVEAAQACGMTRVGWHCFAGNIPSRATALRAGFVLQQEFPAYLLEF